MSFFIGIRLLSDIGVKHEGFNTSALIFSKEPKEQGEGMIGYFVDYDTHREPLVQVSQRSHYLRHPLRPADALAPTYNFGPDEWIPKLPSMLPKYRGKPGRRWGPGWSSMMDLTPEENSEPVEDLVLAFKRRFLAAREAMNVNEGVWGYETYKVAHQFLPPCSSCALSFPL